MIYCKIIDGQVRNITKHHVEGSVRLELINPSPIDLIDKHMVGYDYKIKAGVVIGIPVLVPVSDEVKAENRRKVAEEHALVRFNDVAVKVDVQGIVMLKAYIDAGVELINWKGYNGWLQLSISDAIVLLGLMVSKRQELFDNEFGEA